MTTLRDPDGRIPAARPSPVSSYAHADGAHWRAPGDSLSGVARMQRKVAGKAVAIAGSFNILLGTVLANRDRTAYGHRQRVVGMLQLNCEVDRRTADAFVDRWLSKRAGLSDS